MGVGVRRPGGAGRLGLGVGVREGIVRGRACGVSPVPAGAGPQRQQADGKGVRRDGCGRAVFGGLWAAKGPGVTAPP
ncbi:hypothetical protein SAM23877_7503 [Streptomyces ambofaciens ATCC 23877]|uniref:Uncharacterized protein n=1 Tax=Streptomyces ambofaciens (strain ATCC 23877 / 3486 / DSM 40053 / JCM 4204 / NBRC 12836 / NRRL B-2516) TaxID=278992 RepID=A0A0K2B5K3_STRA7|nr:hypothetical protein SAM23877_7503 [Streptomyces ambofaciens ATCC 23877]